MKKYVYSASTNSFYAVLLQGNYEEAGTWPEDGIAVNESMFVEFSGSAPEGKTRAPGNDGLPYWADIPPLTQDELITIAEAEKQRLIDVANEFINAKQWPSKLALGRLKEVDKAEFNLWLDYLDKLIELDISKAPDINWPKIPS